MPIRGRGLLRVGLVGLVGEVTMTEDESEGTGTAGRSPRLQRELGQAGVTVNGHKGVEGAESVGALVDEENIDLDAVERLVSTNHRNGRSESTRLKIQSPVGATVFEALRRTRHPPFFGQAVGGLEAGGRRPNPLSSYNVPLLHDRHNGWGLREDVERIEEAEERRDRVSVDRRRGRGEVQPRPMVNPIPPQEVDHRDVELDTLNLGQPELEDSQRTSHQLRERAGHPPPIRGACALELVNRSSGMSGFWPIVIVTDGQHSLEPMLKLRSLNLGVDWMIESMSGPGARDPPLGMFLVWVSLFPVGYRMGVTEEERMFEGDYACKVALDPEAKSSNDGSIENEMEGVASTTVQM
ncbi:hypothetical protein BKA70DRAFT_1395418 [Coprinopsis sp. MPI-PUGE-AT-0042]|nr:hypothetical protein BKA70DRAFT_1395418 [Coprinopsis sp. MPI-PUGE-AT-0042]